MKPRVYLLLFLLIVPFQASLLTPLARFGITPDIGLAALYVIGLLTGPAEAALAGMAMGLLQDISSASMIGFSGFTRGLVGLFAGFLGRRVLDIASPSNIIFLAAFSLAEAILIALSLQVFYGSMPFFGLLFSRMLPRALATGALGYVLLRLVSGKTAHDLLRRRGLQKES